MTDPAPDIAVIVPVLNEQHTINPTLARLYEQPGIDRAQVIVVDADPVGSTLAAIDLPRPGLLTLTSPRGRAAQMNAGARRAAAPVLLFLHADTVLPANALTLIRQALADPRIAAGAFDLTIDSPRPVFRLFSRVISRRSRITRVPYGDQAQFFRRKIFDALGGYPDIPLMEDVDIMRRLRKRRLPIRILSAPVRTSPRRWQHEGLLVCTLRNWLIMTLYLLGVSPRILARLYRNVRAPRSAKQSHQTPAPAAPQTSIPSVIARPAAVLFTRCPEKGAVKTRLAQALGPDAALELYTAFLLDTLDKARTLDAECVVSFHPPEKESALRSLLGPGPAFLPQAGRSLGDRMASAFASLFARGCPRAVLFGADLPDLPADHLARALSALETAPAVLAPTRDGGYGLIGFTRAAFDPRVFDDIPWSTPDVFARTLERLNASPRIASRAVILPEWHDIDTLEDLHALIRRGCAQRCPRTAAALARLGYA